MSRQELGDARDGHAATDYRIAEAELLRGVLVVVIVPAAVEELVAHLRRERLVQLDRQGLAGGFARLPGSLLARGIAQADLAPGLLRQKALMMHTSPDQVARPVAHPHFLRDDVAIAPAVAIGHPRAALQDLSDARRGVDLPFLAPPEVAEQVVEIPALEFAVRLLVDDHRRHRPAEGGRGRVPGV